MKGCAEPAFRSNSRQKDEAPLLANSGLTGCRFIPDLRLGSRLGSATAASGAELPMQLQANYAGSCPSTDLRWRFISERRSLWHVAGDTLDDILIAAAQLDDITIGIADEDRDLPTLAEADRSLCDRDIVGL